MSAIPAQVLQKKDIPTDIGARRLHKRLSQIPPNADALEAALWKV